MRKMAKETIKFASVLISGILCSLSLIPGLDFLIWFGLAPLLAVKPGSALESAGLSYSVGIIFFAAISYGIIPDHLGGFLFYILAASLFFPVFTFILWHIRQRIRHEFVNLLAPPLLWVSLEYISLSLFSVPFNLGLQQYRHLWIIQVASITGSYGVSFLIVLINSSLALLWRSWQGNRDLLRSKRLLPAFGVAILLFILNVGYGWWVTKDKDSRTKAAIKIVGLQGNISAYQYDSTQTNPEYVQAIREKYFRMISQAGKLQPDIIVLPEGATANYNFRIPWLRDEIYRLAHKTKSLFIFGSLDLNEEGRVYNSAFAISPSGELISRYDKVKLAPFGEGIICRGEEYNLIPTEFGNLGQMICWESVFPQIARRITRKGAEILFILTNDGDFRISTLPVLHAAEAVFRAVESGRWVVRVANFGISMTVSPSGKVIEQIALGSEGIMQANVGGGTRETIYARVGDMFSWLCLVLTILTIGSVARKSRHQAKDFRRQRQKSKPDRGKYLRQGLRYSKKLAMIIIVHLVVMTGMITVGILAIGYHFQPDWPIKRYFSEFFSSEKLPIEEAGQNFLQARSNTCGPAALAYMLNLWGFETSQEKIGRLVKMEKRGTSMHELAQAAKKLGLNAWGEKQNFAALKKTTLPVIAFIANDHWVVVLEIKGRFVTLFDPAIGHVRVRDDLFSMAWNGYLMLVRTRSIVKSLKENL